MTTITDISAVDARWDSRRLKTGDSLVWRAGHTSVWVQKSVDDWVVASAANGEESVSYQFEQALSLPIDVEWKRWAGLGGFNTVRFNPAFPDRPLVVKTRAPVMISPHQTVDLYINIPVWVEVCVESETESTSLGVFPTRTLSNTWFGSQYEGELCYALKSLARRVKNDLTIEPLAATCRFSIVNRYEEPLPLDRLRVLPRHLSIFKSRRRLWTSPIRAISHGPNHSSNLEYPESPHAESAAMVLVRPPEEAYRPHFFRESLAHYTRALFE
jgi:hypothetical protein